MCKTLCKAISQCNGVYTKEKAFPYFHTVILFAANRLTVKVVRVCRLRWSFIAGKRFYLASKNNADAFFLPSEIANLLRRVCVTRRKVLEFAFGRLGVTTAHASWLTRLEGRVLIGAGGSVGALIGYSACRLLACVCEQQSIHKDGLVPDHIHPFTIQVLADPIAKCLSFISHRDTDPIHWTNMAMLWLEFFQG